jgi:hypothetical protein
MIKNIKLFLLSLVIAASMAVMFIGISVAADQTIICDSSGCSGPGTALFTETNVVPTQSVAKTFEVKNQRSETLTIALSADEKSGTDADFLEKVDVSVDEVGGSNKYSGTLDDFLLSSTTVNLGSLSASTSKEFKITLALQDVGNDYQGKGANFDIAVNVTGEAGKTDTGTAPGSVSAPTCGATVPLQAPSLSASSTSENTVLLTWTPVDPVTHYMIQYGYSSGSYSFGASNVGNTISYSVGSLAGDTTYYFQVAGVNDCAPGPWSNEASATPTGAILGFGPAPGFEQILGTATESGEIKEVEKPERRLGEGQVKTEAVCEMLIPWWTPLVLQAIFTSIFLSSRQEKKISKKAALILVLISLASQLFHWLIGCGCIKDQWCPQYWLFNILIILISLVSYLIAQKLTQK